MSSKIDTQVLIAGKVLTLSGYESEAYLQQVAAYINNKIAEFNKMDSYKRQHGDIKNILLALNIADDYFKAKKQASILEDEIEVKDKEMYDLKHELISSQIQLEGSRKTEKDLDKEISELQKRIIQLETELKDCKSHNKQ